MDAREKLSRLAHEGGNSLAGLSRMLGRNPTYLQQYISKGSPRKLEEEDRRKLAEFFGVGEAELGGPEEKSSETSRDWVEVPRLSVEAAAGAGAVNAVEQNFDTFRFSRRWLREQGLDPAHLSAIRVIGDSMEPLLREGDELLVDCRPAMVRDGVHVVRFDGNLLVKRVAAQGRGQFSLLSQNLAYPPLTASAEEIEVVGRVVWKSGRL